VGRRVRLHGLTNAHDGKLAERFPKRRGRRRKEEEWKRLFVLITLLEA
jgi:hypothetical protein